MNHNTLYEIIQHSLDILEKDVELSPSSLRTVASRSFRPISNFFNNKHEIYYNESLISELEESYHEQLKAKLISQNVYNIRIRGIRIVQEVFHNGTFSWSGPPTKAKAALPENSCLYAVLYCTGMRVSEALSLELSNVSLIECTVLVTETKNGRQRLLPISKSLSLKCGEYLSKRSGCHNAYFFDSGSDHHNGKISTNTAYRYFRKLMEDAGIPHRGRGNGPRLHDIRDTFAVHSLQQLIEQGGDINANLEYLSLYMGHHSIYETQDYLWLTEELAEDMLSRTLDSSTFLSKEYQRKVAMEDV